MKYILALIALTMVTINVAAQQPETDECSFANIVFNTAKASSCLQKEKEADAKRKEEAAAKLAEAIKVPDELRKTTENWNNLHSTNPDQQATGVTDTAKDINSHANSNPASEVVTDKAVSLIDQFEHRKNELLNNTANTVRSGLAPQGGSTSSFNTAEPHQLVEPQGSTLQQQFESRKQVLLSTPSIKVTMPEAGSTRSVLGSQQSDLEEQFQSRKENLLNSAPTVMAVSQAERALQVQAAEQERRDIEARKEAEYRAEIARQARVQAEEKRTAEIERARAAAADDAAEEREERREAAREAREQRAAWNAMFGPPSYVPNTPYSPNLPSYAPYVPSYAPPVSSYGTYLPSDNSSYSPQYGSSGSYLDLGATRPISSPDTFNAFSCMSNLLTESQCLRDHIKPIELSPGCFDDPGSFALPSCAQGLYGGSSNSASPTPSPAADASLTPTTTPPAAPTTAPKTAK
jgi:hypothetical protein